MIYRDYKHWKLKTSNVSGVKCIANEQDRCSKIGYIFSSPSRNQITLSGF